ncbi:MAG: hypothetical protein AVDCRST_MAG13-3565, partial [uncultured Solirubrobacteraceae bacterium]
DLPVPARHPAGRHRPARGARGGAAQRVGRLQDARHAEQHRHGGAGRGARLDAGAHLRPLLAGVLRRRPRLPRGLHRQGPGVHPAEL